MGAPPTLAGKVGAPPTLTKIEKVGGIRGVSEKSQLFMCLKRRSEVDPPVIQNFHQNFWSASYWVLLYCLLHILHMIYIYIYIYFET